MWNRVLTLIWKELLGVWQDPASRASILMPPIIQLFIFTFAATLDVKNATIGILNRDSGAQAFELVQRFHGAPVFSKIIYLEGVEQLAPFIDNQEGMMVLSIDQEFSRLLSSHQPAKVQLILDGRKSNTTQILAGYAQSIISQYNDDFCASVDIKQQNVHLITRNWFNPNLLYYWYNVPCLAAVLSMLAGLVVTSISIAREKEVGTFDQLLVSPLQPMEILIGKMVPGIIVGMFEGSIILLVGVWVFQVPFTGYYWLFFISQLIFIISIIGVGLFISSLSSTQQQAILGSFVFISPSILLSGFATPIENMPVWLQPFTYVIPLRYMLIISKGLFLKAMPAHIVFNNIWPMILIAIVNLAGAKRMFKRKLE